MAIRSKKFLTIVGIAVAIPALLVADLVPVPGIPQIVYDPVVAGNILKELAEAVEEVRIFGGMYNQVLFNATNFSNKSSWRGIQTLLVNSHVATLFGETAGWDGAATAGVNIGGAWQQATYQMNPPSFYSTAAIGNSSLSALIASINVADGISQGSLQAIANARINHPMNDMALSSLEAAAQGTGLDTNSEIEQLNLLTTGSVLSARQAEIQTALMTQIAEQQLIQNKMQRDAAADNINVMGVRDNYLALEPTQWGGSAATIAGYRQ